MTRWDRIISIIGEVRVILALGVVYVLLAVGRTIRIIAERGPVTTSVSGLIMVGIPGLLLLYGGYRLPDADLHPDTHPRVVVWSLGGFGLLLGVVGLRVVSPDVTIDNPFWSVILGTAIGSVAGFGIGMHEAQAVSRARDAEQRNRDLMRYETLIEEATDVNAILDIDRTFQYVTPSVEHVLGYNRDELIGEDATTYIHPDDRDEVIETFTATAEHGERSRPVEFRFKHKEGSWVILEGRSRNLLDDPIIEGIVAYTYDITERKQLEENLRRERDLRERIFETSPVGIMVLNRDGGITFLNDRGEELIGRSKAELNDHSYESPLLEIIDPEGQPIPEEDMPFHRIVASGEPIFDDEFRLAHPDREQIWITVNGEPLRNQAGGVERVVLTFKDITERKRHHDRLVSLNELSQALTAAETKQAVSNLAVETAPTTLPLPLIAIEFYDEETGQLRSATRTEAITELLGDEPLFTSERGLPWRVFSDQTQAVYTDLRDQAAIAETETPLRSAMLFPLGKHGVFIAGATTADAFSDTDVSLAQMLVANMRSALNRVDREQTLRERKNTLAEQNTALERLQRVNETIRGIMQELIQASSREEIMQAVCDQLAAADVYRFAWIGTHDAVTDDITPEVWAGGGEDYLETITVTADKSATGQGPTGRAVRTHTAQIQNNLAADPPFEPWRQAALDRGYQASIAVPLVYQETLYGILNLYAGQPDVFNQMVEAVLTELGETIGYALNALERKQALISEQSVELEFQLRKGQPPLFRFAAEHNCEFEFENIVQRADGPLAIFVTVRGVAPEEVLTFGENSPEIEELTLVSDRGSEALFEAQLRDSAFFSALLDRGAMPQTLTATGEEGYAVIRVPQMSDIRTFVELFEAQYERVELVGRREVDQPIKTQQEFEAEFRTYLTERQEEILKTAYLSGFFDWPRETTAQELAEMFEVSQPTVSRHIRAGERKLFGLVFADD